MATSSMRGGSYAAEVQAPAVYRQRRQRLAAAVGRGTVVLWGGGDERGYGDVGTFRQSPGFFYLTGVELPNAVLVLRPHEEYEALFLPPRNEGVERWTGPKWGPGDDAAAALGFDRVLLYRGRGGRWTRRGDGRSPASRVVCAAGFASRTRCCGPRCRRCRSAPSCRRRTGGRRPA